MTTAAEYNRRVRAAQQEAQRKVDAYNRSVDAANRKSVADYNRRAEAHNRTVIADHNRQVDAHNRKATAHNQQVIDGINRSLAAAGRPQPRYTTEDEALVERVQVQLPSTYGRSTFFSATRASTARRSAPRFANICRDLE